MRDGCGNLGQTHSVLQFALPFNTSDLYLQNIMLLYLQQNRSSADLNAAADVSLPPRAITECLFNHLGVLVV